MSFVTKRYESGNQRTVQTPLAPVAGTVGTASAQIVAQNNDRTGIVLINLSTTTISIGLGNAAVLYGGITLVPNSAWEMDEYTFCVDVIYAIAGADGAKLAIQEFNI